MTKKPPLPQPELPNIPPAPQKPYMVYMVEIIQHKTKVYCKVDTLKIPREITDVEKVENDITLGEVYAIVRGLERVLNKLKKHNIEIKLTAQTIQIPEVEKQLGHELNME